jgi:hypothetical protein
MVILYYLQCYNCIYLVMPDQGWNNFPLILQWMIVWEWDESNGTEGDRKAVEMSRYWTEGYKTCV